MSKPNLREALDAMRPYQDSAFRYRDAECFRLLIDTVERLVDVYDGHALWDVDGSSGSDDANALYGILNAGGLEVA